MKARIAAVCVVVGSALTLAGCGTVDNLCFENPQTNQVPMHVYGGVEADVKVLTEDDGGRANPAADPLKIVYLADLPLSLVADTVTLPVTLPMAYAEKQSHRSNPFPKVPPQTGGPGTTNPPPPPPAQEPSGNGSDNPGAPPGFMPESR
jgi:uncharacterized protein YceK